MKTRFIAIHGNFIGYTSQERTIMVGRVVLELLLILHLQ